MDESTNELSIEHVAIRSVTYYPDNPRKGSTQMVRESLEAHGQYKPLVVQKSTGYVLTGNHTLRAARQLKWKKIAVIKVDVDDEEARKIVLVDNRTSDLSEYDSRHLVKVLQDVDNLVGTGYIEDDVAALLAQVGESPAERAIKQPGEFPDPEAALPDEFQHACPKCGFEWDDAK